MSKPVRHGARSSAGLAVVGDGDGEALATERVGDEVADGGRVVDDEDALALPRIEAEGRQERADARGELVGRRPA